MFSMAEYQVVYLKNERNSQKNNNPGYATEDYEARSCDDLKSPNLIINSWHVALKT
jgi:hypothetical protein